MTKLQELLDIEKLESFKTPLVRFKTLGSIKYNDCHYPIKSILIGSEDRTKPTFGLFGGVHGLERIGSQVIISFLHTLLHQLKWDSDLQKSLENSRIVCIPIINPGGMVRKSRSNPNDVDLMRNAPVEALDKAPFLVSGHRLGRLLPWYRGTGEKLEEEAQILVDFVAEEMFSSDMSIALDVHSGFGLQDQIWYPYAKTRDEFPNIKEVLSLKALLDETFPNHIYKFEPQSVNYITHGDLWDYMFDNHHGLGNNNTFLPLTLELGSWNWIRKNPLQFFSKEGLFHPVKEHRHARIMRRHLLLLDFFSRAVRNRNSWAVQK